MAIGFSAGPYFFYLFDPQMVHHPYGRNIGRDVLFYIHIPAGILWLLSGLAQLAVSPRKNPSLHRINGAIYVILHLMGSLSVFPITVNLRHQTIFRANSFPIMAFSLVTLLLGLYFLYRKDFQRHGSWMIRSLVMPALIPIYNLAASLSMPIAFYAALPYLGILSAELYIGGKLEKRLPWYVIPVVVALCAVSFLLVFSFHWNFVKSRA